MSTAKTHKALDLSRLCEIMTHFLKTAFQKGVSVRETSSKIPVRSQVVYSKQPKLGLAQEFVVLLVRMR